MESSPISEGSKKGCFLQSTEDENFPVAIFFRVPSADASAGPIWCRICLPDGSAGGILSGIDSAEQSAGLIRTGIGSPEISAEATRAGIGSAEDSAGLVWGRIGLAAGSAEEIGSRMGPAKEWGRFMASGLEWPKVGGGCLDRRGVSDVRAAFFSTRACVGQGNPVFSRGEDSNPFLKSCACSLQR